jgi:hypothetical protein
MAGRYDVTVLCIILLARLLMLLLSVLAHKSLC